MKLLRRRVFWKRKDGSIKKIMVSGFLALLVAIAGGISLPIINNYLESTIKFSIIDMTLVKTDSTSALDIVFWNRTKVPVAVTSMTLTFKKRWPQRTTPFEKSAYKLQTNIRGSIVEGYVSSLTEDNMGPELFYPVTGYWLFNQKFDWWLIRYEIPIREEIRQSSHRSIILHLPENVKIIADTLSISGELNLSRGLPFLYYLGSMEEPVEVVISAIYANNQTCGAKRFIAFK